VKSSIPKQPPDREEGEQVDRAIWHETRPTFTQIPDWILAHPEVSDAALRTWLVLAAFADNKSAEAYPKVSTLCEKRRKGRSMIFEHLAQLEAAGALRRQHQYRDDGGLRNTLYVLAWAYPLESVTPRPENRIRVDSDPGPENRMGDPRPENETPPRPENRAARTRTTKELKPPAPTNEVFGLDDSQVHRGGVPPRTPTRSSRKNPRADGTNPRAVATKEREKLDRIIALKKATERGERAARLTNPPMYGTADEYRAHLLQEAHNHLRAIDDELLAAGVLGYATTLSRVEGK
jgi:hypothetical protein